MKTTIVPFIKWAGGKRQIIDELIKLVPRSYNKYYEPFVGGGALFLKLQPKEAMISDLNSELINAYKVIKYSLKRLREYLILMEWGHHVKEDDNKVSSPFYNLIRDVDKYQEFDANYLTFKDSKEFLAARFIYLNKNTFNGLYRVNSKGNFNVPSKHKTNQKIFDYENLKALSSYLKENKIEIEKCDFEKILDKVRPNDFVYLDPPYDYENGKGFDSYLQDAFGTNGQKRLANFCYKLHKQKVNFMLSNHNTSLIRMLYKEFNIHVIKANRNIGGKNASRAKIEEVIITNYDN